MDEDTADDAERLNITQPLLGIYPYVLIQFERHGDSWRVGVDYDHLSEDEVIDMLTMIISDFEERDD